MTFRLYFNRCEDWPQIWSIDCGDASTELNVVGWRCLPGAIMRGARVADISAIDRSCEPVAWCEITAGDCRISSDGHAVFSAAVLDA